MVGNTEANTTKFTVHHRLRGAGRITGSRVAVVVQNIASPKIAAAAGLVDQARRIQSLDFGYQSRRIVLPLSFIENHPHDDGWMVPVVLNQTCQFSFKLVRVYCLRV